MITFKNAWQIVGQVESANREQCQAIFLVSGADAAIIRD